MSQPLRYSVTIKDPWFGNGAYVADDGKYILHSDYEKLKAEYERVIKAGEAMYDHIRDEVIEERIVDSCYNRLMDGWLNALEGSNTK